MTEPVLKLNYLSHGTLESRDIEKSRKFYEEFLGLDVVQTSPRSLMIRLGGTNTIATVYNPKKAEMPMLNHNGLDVASREEVERAHAVCVEQQDKWGIKGGDEAGGPARHLQFLFPRSRRQLVGNPRQSRTAAMPGCSRRAPTSTIGAPARKQGFNPNDFTKRRYK